MKTNTSTVNLLRILYPAWTLIAMASIVVVPSMLIIKGDAIQTAKNISTNEFIFRLGFVGSMLAQILYIIIPILLYKLLKHINVNQAQLMVIFSLISVPITINNEINKLLAISLVNTPKQMMHVLDINLQGQVVPHIFWGLWLFPLGYLVCKSKLFPKLFGVLLTLTGVGYVFGALGKILALDLGIMDSIFEALTFGEVLFILWFVIKGVNIVELKKVK